MTTLPRPPACRWWICTSPTTTPTPPKLLADYRHWIEGGIDDEDEWEGDDGEWDDDVDDDDEEYGPNSAVGRIFRATLEGLRAGRDVLGDLPHRDLKLQRVQALAEELILSGPPARFGNRRRHLCRRSHPSRCTAERSGRGSQRPLPLQQRQEVQEVCCMEATPLNDLFCEVRPAWYNATVTGVGSNI